jgi:hypothetical protein
MGRKSSAKGQPSRAAAGPSTPAPKPRSKALLAGALVIVVVGLAVLVFRDGSTGSAPAPGAAADASTAAAIPSTPPGPQVTPEIVAKAEAAAKFGPRQQPVLPPIPFQGYEPPRPVEMVTTAYRFAAEHPEILSYVPCFCGCERSGHTGNHECFVRQRNEAGDVIAFDEHGVECAVCIDVANRSRQMYEAGASVAAIRAAIDKEFGARNPSQMPTPHPPTHNHATGN